METAFVIKEEPCDIEEVYIKEEPHEESTNLFDTNETIMVQVKIEEKCLSLEVNDSTVKNYDERTEKSDGLKDQKIPNIFPCKYCSKIYKTEYGRSGHEKIHTKGIPVCKICNKTYTTHSNLYQHLKMHTTTRFECDICKMQFSYKQTLKKHMISKHIGQNVDRVQCGVCKKYYIKHHLQRHLESVHLKYKNFKCQICDKKFAERITLKGHLMQVHKLVQEGAGYTCVICQKSLIDEKDYFLHEETHKSKSKKRFKVKKLKKDPSKLNENPESNIIVKEELIIDDDETNDNFNSNCYFNEIPETPLESLEANRCETCKKSFSSKYLLQYHLDFHIYGPYICDICDKKFVRKHSLKKHIKICYIRTKPLMDPVVSVVKAEQLLKEMDAAKKATRRGGKHPHMKVKSGKKLKFICYFCGKQFNRNDYLTRHLKTHSNPVKRC